MFGSRSARQHIKDTGKQCPTANAPRPAASAVQDESIPGIGATRGRAWDDSHTPNAAGANGYGDDPSLPEYLTPSGAVYSYVDDRGTGRIQSYNLIMHPVDQLEVLRRLRQELPSDATVAWNLVLDPTVIEQLSTARPCRPPGITWQAFSLNTFRKTERQRPVLTGSTMLRFGLTLGARHQTLKIGC